MLTLMDVITIPTKIGILSIILRLMEFIYFDICIINPQIPVANKNAKIYE